MPYARDPHPFGEPLSPEFALLLLGSQPFVDNAAATRIEELLQGEIDWRTLSELARSHGLSSMLYERVESFLSRPLPEIVGKLKADAVTLTQHALIHVAEMKRLVRYLGANRIETLVFKGPTLASSIYGRVALRPFSDLDILVQPHAIAAAWSLLEREGYKLSYNISPTHFSELIKSGNHLLLYGPQHECVELHWTLFAKSRATCFDTAGAWSRRIPLTFQDTIIMTLAPRDLIHYLLLHGAKHVWCRLAWLDDVVWFIYKYPAFDWETLLEDARQNGTLRMVLIGLSLANELYGSALDASAVRAIHADAQVLPLTKWMWQRLLTGNQELPTGRELVQLVLRTRERPLDRGRDLYHHLMALRPNNLEDAGRSAPILRMYTLHRLLYLLQKYGRVPTQRKS